MDSHEDDEGPQNEPGNLFKLSACFPVLPLHQGPEARSHGSVASANSPEDSECSDVCSAQSQDSGRTMLSPDLYVLTNDEHWTLTPETHKYAAATRFSSFVTTEKREQQDI